MKRRLDVLDGLRGFSMLLVLFNHVDSLQIIHAFPSSFQQYVAFFFLSGKLGVSFFFILSGFLMTLLYSHPQKTLFIERRYARIFPPFIVMVLCMSVFRTYPQLSLFVRVIMMFSTAYIFRFLWLHVVEKFKLGSVLIRLFLILQIFVAVWYGFFIMRMPVQWFHSLPSSIQWVTTFLVNTTLTLPLGDYIPMLDIVYWTLICEVIFYLLYPTLVAPLISKIRDKSTHLKFFIFLSLIPFFLGTSLLFKELRGFSVMEIEYFIYFCVGIAVAIAVEKKDATKLSRPIAYLFHPFFFIVLLFFAYILSINSIGLFHVVVILFLSLPFGYLVYGLLDHSTLLSSLFSKKIWVFLGTISYPLYICSTPIIDGMRSLYTPTNIFSSIFFLLITVFVSVGVSYVIHEIIETPYFMYMPKKDNKKKQENDGKFPVLFLILFFMISIMMVYTSRYSFLTSEEIYKKESVNMKNVIDNVIKITEKPFIFSFVAKENNLGVVLFPILNRIPSQEVKNNRLLIIKMKENDESKWYAVQETNLAKIASTTSLSFGFPIIADSKDKKYTFELNTKNVSEVNAPSLNVNSFVISTISQANKKELLLNPRLLSTHLINKAQSFISNKTAFLVLLCVAPFLVILLLL